MLRLRFVVVLSSLFAMLPALPGAADDGLTCARKHAENTIRFCRDTYGSRHTPLLVCQLDVATRSLLPATSKLYTSEGRGGAGPTMNNLQFDTGRLRLLYGLTEVTGDGRFAAAADEYLTYFMDKLPDADTGFFPWGDHRGYDVVKDEILRDRHEFKVAWPLWERMYALNPKAVTRQIDSLRLHVIDENRSQGFNRHCPPGKVPHSMNSSGGAWIAGWAFLFTKTGDAKYLRWARSMADYFWSLRDPETGLLAAHPYDPAYPASKSARIGRTEYMDQMTALPANLLRASISLGPKEGAPFREQAIGHMRAFMKGMDIQPDGSFYATFELATGRPLFPRVREGWTHLPQESPGGWANGVVPLRAPFNLAFACKVTGAEDFRAAFDRFLPLFHLERFEQLDGPAQDISAGMMAQAIVALLQMQQATGDASYLDKARPLSRYAIAHYYKDGWFVCGPPSVLRYRDPNVDAWRTYSNRGGSDDLALAVLRLHQAATGQPDCAEDDPNPHF